MAVAYLALGTNLGDRIANLRAALHALTPGVQVLARSQIYETPAWGYTDQPAFLNMVIKAETTLPPEVLLTYVKRLEVQLGRKSTFRWGPRLIDIDILFYDEALIETPALTIPHPWLHERAFVLVPLADVAPQFRHPRLGKTVAELLAAVDAAAVKKYEAPG